MTLPNRLVPREKARANEVMENFDYLESLIGQLAGPGRTIVPVEFVMGKRQNFLMTSAQDTGSNLTDGDQFFQLGYNADWNYSATDNKYRFNRFMSGIGASALRLESGGMSLWTTSAVEGKLNPQMNKVFGIHAESNRDDFIYIRKGWNIRNSTTDETNNSLRLMYTPLTVPKVIYDTEGLGPAITKKKVSDYGLPMSIKGIKIYAIIGAEGTDKANIAFKTTQAAEDPAGFDVFCGAGLKGSGQGDVMLGTGANEGYFTIRRSGYIDAAYVVIQGYWE